MKKVMPLLMTVWLVVGCADKVLPPSSPPGCPTNVAEFSKKDLMRLGLGADKMPGSAASLSSDLYLFERSDHSIENGIHVFDVPSYFLAETRVVYIISFSDEEIVCEIYKGDGEKSPITAKFVPEEKVTIVEVPNIENLLKASSASEKTLRDVLSPNRDGNKGYKDERGYLREYTGEYFYLDVNQNRYERIPASRVEFRKEKKYQSTGRYIIKLLKQIDLITTNLGDIDYLETPEGYLYREDETGRNYFIKDETSEKIYMINEIQYLSKLVYRSCGESRNINSPTIDELKNQN